MAEHEVQHSRGSSLADLDYYNDSQYSPDGSSHYPSPNHSRGPSYQGVSQQQESLRKQPSLAQINVPSFSAFRNQASSIPISSPGTTRKPVPLKSLPRRTPSLAEVPSPRLVDPGVRPYSLDSPLPPEVTGFSRGFPLAAIEDSPERDREA